MLLVNSVAALLHAIYTHVAGCYLALCSLICSDAALVLPGYHVDNHVVQVALLQREKVTERHVQDRESAYDKDLARVGHLLA
jgi:hypothetical protein